MRSCSPGLRQPGVVANCLYFASYTASAACVERCSDPPKESLGSMGKQHHRMKAMKATLVPTNRMKSSILGSSPRRRLLMTKKRSSHGVIIMMVPPPCVFPVVTASPLPLALISLHLNGSSPLFLLSPNSSSLPLTKTL